MLRRVACLVALPQDMVDLRTRLFRGSGWGLARATDVNDEGQIVGQGTHNGNVVGFVLTPKP